MNMNFNRSFYGPWVDFNDYQPLPLAQGSLQNPLSFSSAQQSFTSVQPGGIFPIQYPQYYSNSPYVDPNSYPGYKWKSDANQRLHARSRTQPYSSRPPLGRNKASQSAEASPASQRQGHSSFKAVNELNRLSSRVRPSSSSKLRVPEFNKDDGLSGQIWKLYEENKQTDEIYGRKMALREKLQNILSREFPDCALYVVGSSMTWLGAQSSDIDMCLMLTDSEVDQKRTAIRILQTVRSALRRNKFHNNIQLIPAKVPILKFIDHKSRIEVDLNINNAVGIRNTQLLSSYARIDKRLPPLVVLVKLWARHHNINDAKYGSLSSYSIVLMVIHFLQHECKPEVLPSLQALQPDKYNLNSDIRRLKPDEELPKFKSENDSDLGELFIGFLKYFAQDFDFDRSAMSVRLGCTLPREVVVNSTSPKNRKTEWKYVCIEEPFDLTNVARSIYNPDVFQHIKYVFDLSWRQITKHGDLSYVFS